MSLSLQRRVQPTEGRVLSIIRRNDHFLVLPNARNCKVYSGPIRNEMLKLEDIKKHAAVSGIDPVSAVRIVATEQVGTDALTVYYKPVEGAVLERMLFRA